MAAGDHHRSGSVPPQPARWSPVAALAGLAVWVVGVAARAATPSGGTRPTLRSIGVVGDVLGAGAIVVLAGSVIMVGGMLRPARRSKDAQELAPVEVADPSTPAHKARNLAVVVVVVAAVVVLIVEALRRASVGATVTGARLGQVRTPTTSAVRASSGTPARPVSLGSWEVVAAIVGAAAVAAVLVAVAGRVRRRRPAGEGIPAPAADPGHAIAGVLAELDGEPLDARTAVIGAYARMERLLAEQGRPRHPGETPFEYVDAVVVDRGLWRPAALALTDLYEQARFSQHRIDTDLRDQARGALRALHDALRSPR